MLPGGTAFEIDVPREIEQLVDRAFHRMPRAAGDPLVHQRRNRHLPSRVHLADQVFLRHAHVVVKDFVESGVAGDLNERTHRDPGAVHVDQQVRNALVLGRRGIGAHQQHLPVRAMRQTGPHFLPVDHEGVAVDHRARLQACQVGARAGFGVTLAPDFLAGEHLEQVAFFCCSVPRCMMVGPMRSIASWLAP